MQFVVFFILSSLWTASTIFLCNYEGFYGDFHNYGTAVFTAIILPPSIGFIVAFVITLLCGLIGLFWDLCGEIVEWMGW